MAATSLKHHRILLVSPTWSGALGEFCQFGLEQLGQTVQAFAGPTPLPGFKIHGGKVGRLLAYLNANFELYQLVSRFKPDIMFVIKGQWIHPLILKNIQQSKRVVILNWNPDSPFNPVNSSRWLLQAIPIYDCHFTWGKYLIPELEKAGAKRVEYLPFAYDPRYHFPVEGLSQMTDVCFVGTWEPEREGILRHLTDLNLGIWGGYWREQITDEKIRDCWRGNAKYGREMCEIYASSKIVLNLIRVQNRTSHNMRTFEVPATNSFMLTTRTQEQIEFLGEDKGMACFNSIDELREKIEYYLVHPKEREQITNIGYEQIQEHTYVERMKAILDIISIRN